MGRIQLGVEVIYVSPKEIQVWSITLSINNVTCCPAGRRCQALQPSCCLVFSLMSNISFYIGSSLHLHAIANFVLDSYPTRLVNQVTQLQNINKILVFFSSERLLQSYTFLDCFTGKSSPSYEVNCSRHSVVLVLTDPLVAD